MPESTRRPLGGSLRLTEEETGMFVPPKAGRAKIGLKMANF